MVRLYIERLFYLHWDIFEKKKYSFCKRWLDINSFSINGRVEVVLKINQNYWKMCKILNSSLINLIKFPSNNLKIFSSKDRENKWEKNWKWLKISINNFTTRSSIYNYLLDMTCIAKTSMRVVQMTIPLKINCERNLLRIMLLRSYISMLKLYIYFLLDYPQQLISNNFNFLKFVAISKHWPASNEQKNNYTKLFY